MSTSKKPAATKAAKAPATSADAAKVETVLALREIEANAKHDDPRQTCERLAKVMADAIESTV